MTHLPRLKFTIVVMVNAYPTSSIDDITKRLIKQVLKEMRERESTME